MPYGSFQMTSKQDFTWRRVREEPQSEFSSNNAWNQNFNTSNPGNQNNNNKNNSNRARAVRRPEPPACNVTIEELFQAYYDCRKRKRNSASALEFEINLEQNLVGLYKELVDGTYEPSRSICFAVLYPKPREIWAAQFKDRIIHHVIYNRTAETLFKKFIYDSCACIPTKGTHFAVTRAEHHLRSATQNWTKMKWVLQLDVASFFVSINKHILETILQKHTKDDYTFYLSKLVLHNDPTVDPLYTGNRNNLKLIPHHKSLFNQSQNGLPIGNLTSQLWANVYLNELDHYAKRVLKIKHYIRYVDDILVVGDSTQQLMFWASQLSQYVTTNLGIEFHRDKTHIQRADQGVNFVGYILKPWCRYIRRRTVNRLHYKLHIEDKNLINSVNSYFGLLRFCKSWKFRQKLASKIESKGLRINTQLTKAQR